LSGLLDPGLTLHVMGLKTRVAARLMCGTRDQNESKLGRVSSGACGINIHVPGES